MGAYAGGSLTSGDNNIYIGNDGADTKSGAIRIGSGHTATFIAGISGNTVTGDPVVVAADGQLGTADISTLQGPPGPQGEPGPQGPQGETGDNRPSRSAG